MLKKIFPFTLICLYSLTAFAQFDGTIDMKLTTAEGGGNMKMFVSKYAVKTAMDMKAENMSIQMTTLVRFDKPNTVYLINDKSKSYSEIDLNAMKDMAKGIAPQSDKYKVTKLGKEKILGYECEHVLLSNPDGDTEMWVAKGFIDFETFKKFNQNDPSADGVGKALKEAKAEGMPLKQIANKGTPSETKMEVVKIDKKKLLASEFEIPKGYTKSEGGLFGAGMDMMPEEAKAQMKDELKNMTPEQKKQMKEALKNMTPEQRKMMEKMLEGGK